MELHAWAERKVITAIEPINLYLHSSFLLKAKVHCIKRSHLLIYNWYAAKQNTRVWQLNNALQLYGINLFLLRYVYQ